jgi:two-component system, LytTR family, response regulator
MKALIVDDEPDARARLMRLLQKHPEICLIGEAQNGVEALEKIEELEPDLLFLDIEMPGLNGFEVLRSIPDGTTLPLVIFVTGFDEHALAAFEANALAYLLKPVEADRLAVAVERAEKLSSFESERDQEQSKIERLVRETPRKLRQIVCRKLGRVFLVPAEQILWFLVEDGLVKANVANDCYLVNHQLVELEAALPADLFFRARREVLVNLSKIREIKPYFKSGFLLVMADSSRTEIVVSERQVHPLRQRLPGL